MMKPKRITPEQYVVLAKLGMPVTCVSRYSSEVYRNEEALIKYMLDDSLQINNRNNCEARAKHDYLLFYTLVEDSESTEGATSTECV